jgi:HEAT repeats
MSTAFAGAIAPPRRSSAGRLARLCLLALPGILIAGAASRFSGDPAKLLWLGAAVELGGCAFALTSGPGWQGSADLAVIVLYLAGIGWLTGAGPWTLDWYCHIVRAVLLIVPLSSFGAKFLRDSGALALQRARKLAIRLARRVEWPDDLADCALVPEVADLREAMYMDASPAIGLLANPRPQVRLAALAVLQRREQWGPQQAETVLKLGRDAAEPEIRVATIRALVNVTERELVEGVCEFLYDPSSRVRRAAAETALSEWEANWSWVRPAVRKALGEPRCHNDGPLRAGDRGLGAEALSDLTAWASEKGLLGLRAALTLGDHYARQLSSESDSKVLSWLKLKVEDVHAPPMLRLEFARILHKHKALDARLLRHLVSPSTPAPLRLLAVEGLLASGESDQAVAALHDLARLPNREIALAVAEVAQRNLGVDFGLKLDQPKPSIQSQVAAEVARRVLAWTTQQEVGAEPPSEP